MCVILPDYLNYSTYQSSTQTACQPKKASGISGTSQRAPIAQHPDLLLLHRFEFPARTTELCMVCQAASAAPGALTEHFHHPVHGDGLPTAWDQQEGNKKQVKQMLCDSDQP